MHLKIYINGLLLYVSFCNLLFSLTYVFKMYPCLNQKLQFIHCNCRGVILLCEYATLDSHSPLDEHWDDFQLFLLLQIKCDAHPCKCLQVHNCVRVSLEAQWLDRSECPHPCQGCSVPGHPAMQTGGALRSTVDPEGQAGFRGMQ